MVERDAAEGAVAVERGRLTEEAKASGKPANIIDKIVDGRLKGFYAEQGVLVEQPFAKDDTKTVSKALADAGLKQRVERLSSIDGVGPITALTWALEVGDPHRFSSIACRSACATINPTKPIGPVREVTRPVSTEPAMYPIAVNRTVATPREAAQSSPTASRFQLSGRPAAICNDRPDSEPCPMTCRMPPVPLAARPLMVPETAPLLLFVTLTV